MLPELRLNDLVRLRKAHPCGSYEWRIIRLGADIGLECLGCNRRILLTRRELSRRMKIILPKKKRNPGSQINRIILAEIRAVNPLLYTIIV